MRVVKVVLVTLLILATIAFQGVEAKEKKVKVYLDAPTKVGHNEEFVGYLVEQMRIADFEDDSFELKWVKATEAEFIITMIADKNRLPVQTKNGECTQYVMSLTMDRLVDMTIPDGDGGIRIIRRFEPDRANSLLNQHMGCDPNDVARRAVIDLVKAMGLKPEWKIKFPGRMQ